MKKKNDIIIPNGLHEVLLHACCAPCSSAIVEWMLQHDIRPTIFYFNPNIYPREEYDIRKNESKRHAESLGIRWIDGDYDHEQWLRQVKGLEKEPERGSRCLQCFRMRLMATALQAKELGIEITPQGASWDDIDPDKYSQGVVWGFGSADPFEIEHQYDSRVACVGYDNPGALNDSSVDSLIDQAMAQDVNSSYSTWTQAAKQATSQNSFLWIGTMDYTYFVSDDLDISNSTALIYPHGGDIWGNIYDWTRINATANATA